MADAATIGGTWAVWTPQLLAKNEYMTAAAATIGGTWAVWTQQLLAKNEYMTAKYSTFLQEDFESPKGWLPGEETRKAVWVKNESTIPIIAKITMNQNWVRR